MSFVLPDFYPILDTAWLAARGRDPEETVRRLLGSGARIVQLRHKGDFDRAAFALAMRIAKLVEAAGALYFVNDRVDVALLTGADGVHVGQDDLPPAAVRAIAGDRLLIGYSTHDEAQVAAADREAVDYVAFGPVFPTSTKENPDPAVGLELLRRARALTVKPLVAIGGMDRERAESVYEAGANSAAVIAAIDDWVAD